MDIHVQRLDDAQKKSPPDGAVGFGGTFSNYIFEQRYTPDKGWHDATIQPYHKFEMDPASAVLHYAQTIFEGTKAYRRPDGKINLFRPWENVRRFNESARRMAMPTVDEEEHLQAIVELVELDAAWVPDPPGALYIRPVMIATDAALGVHASKGYLHYIIIGPVGSYFKEGFNPVPVYISDTYRRAVLGGTGAAKTGGNYAASLLVGQEAAAKGYSQVLWLDGIEGRYVEEVGAMNICFVYEGQRIITPELSGSILPGITRKSVIELGRDLGYDVSEERVDVHQMLDDVKSGKITEVFGCGTAAVIAPVGKFGYRGDEFLINNYEVGAVSKQLYRELTDIQFGRKEDPYDWTYQLDA